MDLDMKTINNIIKKIDLNARVDYDTARCLMLMGMPQGKAVLTGVISTGENYYEYQKIGQPFYVTTYRMNLIHDYEDFLTHGHNFMADKMCYAPTVREALEFVKTKLYADNSDFSSTNVSFEIARVLYYLGMPQGQVLCWWKPTKVQFRRYGQPFYVTIYKTNTVRKLVSLNKGHDRDADAMCYAPTMNEALEWVEDALCND